MSKPPFDAMLEKHSFQPFLDLLLGQHVDERQHTCPLSLNRFFMLFNSPLNAGMSSETISQISRRFTPS